jgi:tellurite resistance protein
MGQTMGYWPSYREITPAARRSYLEWLAGSRSDSTTYIGYVFLYFYGLERRLMVDNGGDADLVVAEVRRLLGIYGHNGSFSRYANELLSAYQLLAREPSPDLVPDVEGNGYEVPTAIKLALGLRVRDGRNVEPDLLLRYAMTHPETRVRTPARRAPELLREIYRDEVEKEHPSGVRVNGGRFKMLKVDYRACSGSFHVEIPVLGGDVPDVSGRAEPLATARKIFERSSDLLDDYSRALGRSPGMKPTLAALSRLPSAYRRKHAAAIEPNPLARLDLFARAASHVRLSDLAEFVGVDLGSMPSKAKLKELSQLLASFGFGNSADPSFAARTAAAEDNVVLFPIETLDEAPQPSQVFRHVQLSTMLGMVIGHADGEFHSVEKKALLDRIAASELTSDECRRLGVDIELYEKEPHRLDDWVKKVKDIPAEAKAALASELVAIAGSDGNVHPAEVKQLETFFRKLGLEQKSLYDRLHAGGRTAAAHQDEPELVIEAGPELAGIPIPPQPKTPSAPSVLIDLGRLASIRSETKITASVLAEIFEEEEGAQAPTLSPPVPADAHEDEFFEGLERRCGALLLELVNQSSWSSDDFERVVRGAGLMPGAAREMINDWALDRFDELLIDGDDPIEIAIEFLPRQTIAQVTQRNVAEGSSA